MSFDPVILGRFFFLVALMLAGPTAPLGAQDVTANLPELDSLRIDPGGVVGIPVLLRNNDTVNATIRISTLLPDGWRQMVNVPPLIIAPGETVLRLLILSSPRTAKSGRHELSLFIHAFRPDYVLAGPIKIPVRVNALREYELESIDAPSYVVEGSSIPYLFEIRNKGNDSVSFATFVASSLEQEIEGNPGTITLAPRTARRFSLRVATPSRNAGKVQHSLSATIVPLDGGERRSVSVVTDIVSGATTAQAPHVQFPTYGRVRFVGEGSQSAIQGEFSGIGSLREDGRDRFELLVRSPETQTTSPLGQRDEYRVRFRGEGFELFAGDWNYSLSPLTEFGRYAFGIGGRSSIGKATIGGFANRTRLGSPVWRQSGAFVRYPVSERFEAGANILRRSETTTSTTTSLSAIAVPFQNNRLEAEAGLSSSAVSQNLAYAIRWNGSLPIGSYEVRLLDAGPGYTGYQRDVRVSSLSVSGLATKDVRVELLARSERRNVLNDTLRGTAPRSDFLQLGGGFSNFFSVYLRTSALSDPLSLSGMDVREDLLQIRSSYDLAWGLASAYADYGAVSDRRRGTSSPSRRIALSLDANPTPANTVSTSIEFSDAPDFLAVTSTKRTSFTLSVSSMLFEQTQANLSFFSSNATGGQSLQYSSLDASVSHVFPWGHNARLHVRQNVLSGTNEATSFAVDYGMPLGIPLGRKTSEGALTGRVVDSKGVGRSDVMLSVGSAAAMSGPDGRFALSAIPAGEQFLTIDRGTLGIEWIPAIAVPLPLMIVGGEESHLTIPVARSSRLEGDVRVFGESEDDSAAFVSVPFDANFAVVAELNSGLEILRRQTDPHGKFVIGDIRPGHWTLTYVPRELPAGYRLEKEKEELEVTEGGTINVSLRILPRKKSLRILQQGGVLQAESGMLQSEISFGNFTLRFNPSSGGYFVLSPVRDVRQGALTDQRILQAGSRMNVLIERIERPGERPSYRAIAGPFKTLDEAKEFCTARRQ